VPRINTKYPYWFCGNDKKYSNREETMYGPLIFTDRFTLKKSGLEKSSPLQEKILNRSIIDF
jgi:hypothetical protein